MRAQPWKRLAWKREWALMGVLGIGLSACGGGGSGRPGSGTGAPGTGNGVSSTTGASNSDPLGPAGGAGGAANGAGGSPSTGTSAVGTTSAATALPTTEIALTGGVSSASGGLGQPGGKLHVMSKGGIAFDPTASGAPVPSIPGPPAGAKLVGAPDLAADASTSEAVVVEGTTQSGGSEPTRLIAAGGDVYISGTLRGADLGSSRQGFDIEAPGHTIYISGSIDTSGAGGQQSGGSVTLNADAVVMSGSIVTTGSAGAAAGSLSIKAGSSLSLAGTVDASGGDGSDGGGPGAAVTLAAMGDVAISGTIRTRGGAVTGTADGSKAGDAGAFTIDCAGSLSWSATFDGRGGPAVAKAAGSLIGGAAANFTVGGTTAPKAVVITVPAVVTGGSGAMVGGDGGSIELDAQGGDLVVAANLDVSGGDSANKPGAGGTIQGYPGTPSSNANLDVSAEILANGGSVPAGSAIAGGVNGGAGGLIKLLQHSLGGNDTTEATADIHADGGKSAGSGPAGPGGTIYLFTKDGNLTVHGRLETRGGDAPDSGGTGGQGGFVYVFSGDGHDRQSGILIIAADGVIDSSGGNGTIGGSARNDGKAGSLALWPSHQDDEFDVEQTAVLINSDGVHGSDRGWLDMQGKIIARGGQSNGSGGDVQYHGKRQDGNETPLRGDVDNKGDGTGLSGDFAGE